MVFTLGNGEGAMGRGAREEGGRAGGREAVCTRAGPNGLFLALGRRGAGISRRRAAWLEGAGAAGPALGQQWGLEGAVASAMAGRQHLAGEVVQGVVGFWKDSRAGRGGHLARVAHGLVHWTPCPSPPPCHPPPSGSGVLNG